MEKNKKKNKYNRINFLKTFFEEEEGYEEKKVNGFWLIKCWDGNYKQWRVNIYDKESYKNYKDNKKDNKNELFYYKKT